MRKYCRTFLVIAFLLISSPVSHAQNITEDLGDLEITVSPEAPEPFGQVNFRMADYSIDLSSTDIRWLVNGRELARGVGLVQFSTKVGALGQLTTVVVRVSTKNGLSLSKEIRIRPASVDLIWQADSSVPIFYKGKALPSTKNELTIFAVPHILVGGKRVDPSQLRYSWSLDFDTQPYLSGVGKSTLVTKIVDLIGQTDISVDVSTLDNKSRAHGHISISPFNTRALIYELDPLTGVNLTQPILGTLTLSDQETTLYASDFFFPKSHKKKEGLFYQWSLNGKGAIANDKNPNTLTIRQEGANTGSARVSVSVSDPFDSLIKAVQNFMVEFGSTGTFQ